MPSSFVAESNLTETICQPPSKPVAVGSTAAPSNVTVTAGVHVGRANLVCAGAVVTHDTSDYAILAGIPARQVGHIDPASGAMVWDASAPA